MPQKMPVIIMHPWIPSDLSEPTLQLRGPYIMAQEATKLLLSAISATINKRPMSEPQMKQDSGCHCPSSKAGTKRNLRDTSIQSLDEGRRPAFAFARNRLQISKTWKQPVSSCRKRARCRAHLCIIPGNVVMVNCIVDPDVESLCPHLPHYRK